MMDSNHKGTKKMSKSNDQHTFLFRSEEACMRTLHEIRRLRYNVDGSELRVEVRAAQAGELVQVELEEGGKRSKGGGKGGEKEGGSEAAADEQGQPLGLKKQYSYLNRAAEDEKRETIVIFKGSLEKYTKGGRGRSQGVKEFTLDDLANISWPGSKVLLVDLMAFRTCFSCPPPLCLLLLH